MRVSFFALPSLGLFALTLELDSAEATAWHDAAPADRILRLVRDDPADADQALTVDPSTLLMPEGPALVATRQGGLRLDLLLPEGLTPPLRLWLPGSEGTAQILEGPVRDLTALLPAEALDPALPRYALASFAFETMVIEGVLLAMLDRWRAPAGDGVIPERNLVIAAEGIKRAGRPDLAMAMLANNLPRRVKGPERGPYSRAFEFFASLRNYDQSVERLCLRDLVINGETSWTMIALGHCAYKRGKYHEADALYVQAARLLTQRGELNHHSNRAVFSWRGQAFTKAVDRLGFKEVLKRDNASRVSWDVDERPHQAQIVHLISCDAVYFERYAQMHYLSSIDHADVSIMLHVHVANPTEAVQAQLSRWRQDCPHPVSWSFEHNEGQRASRGWYIGMRYVLMPQLLRRYALPVMLADVDSIIAAPWSQFVAKIAQHDLVMAANHQKTRAIPWGVPAPFFMSAPTRGGTRFTDLVAKYIMLTYNWVLKADSNWGIDLAALGAAYDYLARGHKEAPNIGYARMKDFITLANYEVGGKAAFTARTAAERIERAEQAKQQQEHVEPDGPLAEASRAAS